MEGILLKCNITKGALGGICEYHPQICDNHRFDDLGMFWKYTDEFTHPSTLRWTALSSPAAERGRGLIFPTLFPWNAKRGSRT